MLIATEPMRFAARPAHIVLKPCLFYFITFISPQKGSTGEFLSSIPAATWDLCWDDRFSVQDTLKSLLVLSRGEPVSLKMDLLTVLKSTYSMAQSSKSGCQMLAWCPPYTVATLPSSTDWFCVHCVEGLEHPWQGKVSSSSQSELEMNSLFAQHHGTSLNNIIYCPRTAGILNSPS